MQVICLENITEAQGIEQFDDSNCDKAFGIDDKLHMNQRYNGATKNANVILGCNNRSIVSNVQEAIVSFYSTFIRAQLNYLCPFQLPH